jgi:hypothetical protein
MNDRFQNKDDKFNITYLRSYTYNKFNTIYLVPYTYDKFNTTYLGPYISTILIFLWLTKFIFYICKLPTSAA